jgi:hypothetical protein
VDALIESVQEAAPKTYAEIQKLVVGASIFAQRNGPQGHIGHNLFMMVSNTMYCRVCFKLREQLPPGNHLVCCPKCLWGWTCKQHRWVPAWVAADCRGAMRCVGSRALPSTPPLTNNTLYGVPTLHCCCMPTQGGVPAAARARV